MIPGNSRPNVLLVTADQWRGDCLGSVGHAVVRTPNLDALLARSWHFRRHFTNAVPCGPSRASLHTGLYLHNHRSGTNGTPLDTRFTNWAQVLRAEGYDPVLFGYTHTGMDPRGVPVLDPRLWNDEGVLPGIRAVVDMATYCDDWRDFLAERGYSLPVVHGATYGMKGVAASANVPPPALFAREHSDTWFLVDRLLAFLADHRQARAGEPFCAHLSLRAPHPPWVAPAPYNTLYDLESLPLPVRHGSADLEGMAHPWLRAHLQAPRNRSHDSLHRYRLLQASYYGLMTEVDDNIGRLVAWLQGEGVWDNTVFVFTSDHGEQMGDHWLYGKAGFFDASYHIPLIVSAPGLGAGTSDGFSEHVDIMPTLLDLLGVPAPRQCDGTSLLPVLSGRQRSVRDAAHFEYDFRHSEAENVLGLDMERACLNVIRDDRYKYVHFADLPPLLYDLGEDPGELVDVARSRPEVVARYAGELLSWRMATTDKTLSHLQVTKDRGLVDHAMGGGA